MEASHVMSVFLLIGCLFPVVTSFKWTTGPDSDSPLRPCPGDNVTLKWDFDLAEDDIVTSVQWLLVQGSKGSKPVALAFPFGQFLKAPNVKTKMEHLPPAGLRLYNVSTRDLGTYIVQANLFSSGTPQNTQRSVTLAMPDTPTLSENRLAAWLEPGTVTVNGTSHARLACGTILNHQLADFSVAWKMPSGRTVDSSYHGDGVFYLLLENPVEGGVYSCFLRGPTSFTCRPSGSPVGLVHVHQLETRLSVLEASAGRHDSQLQRQDQVDRDMKETVDSLEAAVQQEANDTKRALEKETERLDIRLDTVDTRLDTVDTRLDTVDTRLDTEVAELTKQVDTLDSRVDSLDTELANLTAEYAQQLDAMEKHSTQIEGDLKALIQQQAATIQQQAATIQTLQERLDTQDSTIQTLQASIDSVNDSYHQQVAFTAYPYSNIPASNGNIIVFNKILENTGNAYNPSTGVFTAPYDGLYVFIVNVDVDGSYTQLFLKKNGETLLYGHDDSASGSFISTSGVLRLKAGDTVAMYHATNVGTIDEGRETTFSGFLLH